MQDPIDFPGPPLNQRLGACLIVGGFLVLGVSRLLAGSSRTGVRLIPGPDGLDLVLAVLGLLVALFGFLALQRTRILVLSDGTVRQQGLVGSVLARRSELQDLRLQHGVLSVRRQDGRELVLARGQDVPSLERDAARVAEWLQLPLTGTPQVQRRETSPV